MQALTKEEKKGLIGAAAFSIFLYWYFKDLLFALALPFGTYLFYAVGNRAFGVSWLVRLNDEEAVFRKPVAARTVYGAMALAMGWAIALWVHLCLPGKHPQDIGIGIFGLAFLLLVEILFLLGTGPMDTRFEFGKGRILYRMGFPLLSWTRSADKSEVASLCVSQGRGAYLYLKWKRRGRVSGSVAQFGTAAEAQAMAEHIGSRLVLPVDIPLYSGL